MSMEEVACHAELLEDLERLWREGLPSGDKTGWPSVDKLYTVVPGQLTVITGWPGSGKSEWLDALVVNLMHQGWRTALFSPENQPIALHAAKLLEKVTGMPFGHGPTERMTLEDIRELSIQMLPSRIVFVRVPEGGSRNVQSVIDAAVPWLDNFKGQKRALVIDPWNELDHARPSNLSETEYISQQLSLARNWARANNVHVFIVAHPRNPGRKQDEELKVPRPDMIAGSQHWWNKADNAITVFRTFDDGPSEVEIHVQKVRFKHVGRIGAVRLRYDRVTGRYHEIPRLEDVKAYRGSARGDE